MRGGALNITVVSVDGVLNFGFLGARDTLPHLRRLSTHLDSAMNELLQITATRPGSCRSADVTHPETADAAREVCAMGRVRRPTQMLALPAFHCSQGMFQSPSPSVPGSVDPTVFTMCTTSPRLVLSKYQRPLLVLTLMQPWLTLL